MGLLGEAPAARPYELKMAENKGGVDVSPGMTICKPTDLKAALKTGTCLLGLDVGRKTIGVASSDLTLTIATPLMVLERSKFSEDAAALFELMDEHAASGLVIGLPLEMSGKEGRQAQSVRTFANNLLALRELPIAFWDERLSTVAVERVLIESADLSRAKRARSVDRAAAAYILQGALDSMGN